MAAKIAKSALILILSSVLFAKVTEHMYDPELPSMGFSSRDLNTFQSLMVPTCNFSFCLLLLLLLLLLLSSPKGPH